MDGPIANADAWASLLENLRAAVTRQQFETWFRSMRLREVEGGTATFVVPSPFLREWIEGYYLELLRRLTAEALGREVDVRVVDDAAAHPAVPAPAFPARESGVDGADTAPRRTEHPGPSGCEPPPRRGTARRVAPARRPSDGLRGQLFGHPRYPNFLSDVLLNEEYVLENFVQGPSNELAMAAAQAVANAPGQAYNPLFLHGSVGLGKTHLLQAICHRILAKRPDARILYLSCETFVNQFISAVEAGELEDFRYRYRHVDMLLIDDIHFLARKERTQEEFFHTFNTLYNSRRQIVLSCDSPPREIPTLEDRLVSRFKWGLVAEIEQPDHETRIRIVRRKADRRGVALPEGVAELIADAVTTNVREIEGAVLRVIGLASLTKKPLTRELAEEALRDLIRPKERKVSLDTILRAVCEHYGVKPSDLIGKRRHRSVSQPRQVCMYLARRLTDLSLVEIGGQIGGRDHTTVIYANERVAADVERTPRVREDLDAIVRRIRSGE
jgi:chromosomal replication initiator protein